MDIIVVDHPLVGDRLRTLRDSATDTAGFRDAMDSLGTMLCYEAFRTVPTVEIPVTTPVTETTGLAVDGVPLLVPVLRAGQQSGRRIQQAEACPEHRHDERRAVDRDPGRRGDGGGHGDLHGRYGAERLVTEHGPEGIHRGPEARGVGGGIAQRTEAISNKGVVHDDDVHARQDSTSTFFHAGWNRIVLPGRRTL